MNSVHVPKGHDSMCQNGMTPCAKRALWVVPKRHISNTYNNTYNKTNNNTYIHTKINFV